MKSSFAALSILIAASVASLGFSSLLHWCCMFIFGSALAGHECILEGWYMATLWSTDSFAQENDQEQIIEPLKLFWSWFPTYAFPFFPFFFYHFQLNHVEKGTRNCTSLIKRYISRWIMIKFAQNFCCGSWRYPSVLSMFSKSFK